MRAGTEQCDDGNTVSGDGCSSTCTVEPNFICVGGSLTTPDICYCNLAVTSAAFSGRWTIITVNFNQNIAINTIGGNPCQSLLTNSLYLLLGSGATCTTSGSSLVINLGVGSGFTANTQLAFNLNALNIPLTTCKSNAMSNIAIAADPYIASPVAQITAPSTIALCNSLILSGASSNANCGGLTILLYQWQVIDVAPIWAGKSSYMASFQSYMSTLTASTASIPASQLIADKQYTFGLMVTNSLGATGSTTAIVTTSDGVQPNLIIVGPYTQYFYNYQHIILRAIASLYICPQTSSPFTSNDLRFNWTLNSTSDTAKLNLSSLSYTSTNLNYIELFPYAANPGNSYIFNVTTFVQGFPNLAVSAYIQINILYGSLIAIISGQNRTVYGESFLLDGRQSYDTSVSPVLQKPTGDPNIAYKWNCTTILSNGSQGSCLYTDGNPIQNDLGNLPFATINSSNIPTSDLGFSLIISKDTRTASSSITISVRQSTGTKVIAPYILSPLVNIETINPDSTVILRAIYQGNMTGNPMLDNVTFKWSCIDGPCSGVSFLSPVTQLAVTAYIPSTNSSYVSFQISSIGYNGSTASASLKLPINSPPLPGQLIIYPPSGLALLTQFYILAVGWADPESNYPLTYEFSPQQIIQISLMQFLFLIKSLQIISLLCYGNLL